MTSAAAAIPVVVLAGSDERAARLPPEGRDKHALSGYKGIDLQIAGRPIVAHLVDRLRDSGELEPIWIAGPARLYDGIVPGAEIIDTEGSLATNIRAAVDCFLRRYPSGPCAFVACDVLPDPAELAAWIADYRASSPCDVWFPMVRAPARRQELRASAWKPEYRVVPAGAQEPVAILPSHLMIVDVRALRLGFVYRLMQLAYRTRNRPISIRRRVMTAEVLATLVYHDFLHLFSFRLPKLTWSVLSAGLRAAQGLKAGNIRQEDLERDVWRIVVKARHRRRYRDRGVRLPVLEGLSFAQDVDTEEEAEELRRELEGRQR